MPHERAHDRQSGALRHALDRVRDIAQTIADAALRDAQVRYDPTVRRRDYADASKILIHDAPFVVVYWDVNVIAYNTDLRNFVPSPFITDFWNAWAWEI